ncbi:MAG: CsbD family protein [Candidatus Promineofilum sp.]|nr:CsbD family protein [Promineifilum sp.]MCW5863661.1 CsbD family protein [Anaerolineae bacterium]
MNDDVLGGMWKQLKGKVKQQWGELTDDDLDRISGKRDEVVGLVQERYGWKKEKAEMEVDNFFKSHSQQSV